MNSLIPWKRNAIARSGSATQAPVSSMRLDWDRMFDRFLDDFWSQGPTAGHGVAIEVSETDDEVLVRAEVPGIAPKDLEISLSGDVLTLVGHKADGEEARNGARVYTERRYGEVRRAVQLPSAVDPERVEAEHQHGVVTVTLQKADAVRPKRIQIKER